MTAPKHLWARVRPNGELTWAGDRPPAQGDGVRYRLDQPGDTKTETDTKEQDHE